jgi:hypothetical protein
MLFSYALVLDAEVNVRLNVRFPVAKNSPTSSDPYRGYAQMPYGSGSYLQARGYLLGCEKRYQRRPPEQQS